MAYQAKLIKEDFLRIFVGPF